MPRYYFNISDDTRIVDCQDAFFADDSAARAHAVRAFRRISAELVSEGHESGHHFVQYVDAAQIPLGEVRVDEVIQIIRSHG